MRNNEQDKTPYMGVCGSYCGSADLDNSDGHHIFLLTAGPYQWSDVFQLCVY